jgi:sortase A
MRSARARAACCVAALALLAACGGSDNGKAAADTAPTTIAPAAVTVPVTERSTIPPTTVAPTTVPETTLPATTAPETTVPETTVAPTTAPPPAVAAALPTPVAAPVDSRGAEAVNQLGTIEIPKIGLNVPMYEGIRLTTLDRGPGHWPGTAMPGQNGNVVVAGHRVSHAKPFRKLDQLTPGDEVIFTTADGRFVYTVTSTEIVTPDAIRIVDQTPDRTATLFACHPPGSTRERIVVHLAFAG